MRDGAAGASPTLIECACLGGIGFEPTGLGPQEFSEHHAAEMKRWVAFMTEIGLRK